ncbi:MAG: RNA polymerase sigma factor [Planctomycetota bacterium]
MSHDSDTALIEAALNGDPESFTELCRLYYPAMVAIAHSILADRHLAEDAAQQAFANAVRKLPQLKKKKKFAAWLAAICRNAALDLAKTRHKTEIIDNISATTEHADNSNVVSEVRAAISRLSASHKEIIYLRYYDAMTYERISTVLGISQQAINGRLRRAKKQIEEHLQRNGFSKAKP